MLLIVTNFVIFLIQQHINFSFTYYIHENKNVEIQKFINNIDITISKIYYNLFFLKLYLTLFKNQI